MWASMDKGMGPCVFIAHMFLHRIIPMFIIYAHDYECTSKL